MRVFIYNIVSLSLIILLLFSCGRKHEPSEVTVDTLSQVDVSQVVSSEVSSENSKGEQDENYKAALRAQMSGMRKMEKVVQSGGIDEKTELLAWMQGTWRWSGQIHVEGSNYATVSSRLIVNGEMITLYGDYGVLDKGTIKYYDIENGTFTFGNGTRVEFDNEKRILYFDKKIGEIYKKGKPSSTNNTSKNSSSYSRSSQSASYGNQYSDISWIYGTWKIYTGGTVIKAIIGEDYIDVKTYDIEGEKQIYYGKYKLYMNRIEVNGIELFKVDLDRKRIYTLDGKPFMHASSY